jgi:DNA-binding MarR family transcriptional regulator
MDRRSSLGYQINHLARLLAHALAGQLAPHGVVPGQFAQLLALYEKDGVTQDELCGEVRIDQSTMSHTLKRMERDGLIQRSPDPTDRRKSTITLTERARSLEQQLVEGAQRVNAVAMRGFTDAERSAYLDLSARAIANLADRHTLD